MERYKEPLSLMPSCGFRTSWPWTLAHSAAFRGHNVALESREVCLPALPPTRRATLGKVTLLSLSFLIYKTGILIMDTSCTYPASEVVRITCVNACHELTIMPGLRKCQQMEAINIANTYFRSRLTLPAFLKLSINNRETRANHSAG